MRATSAPLVSYIWAAGDNSGLADRVERCIAVDGDLEERFYD